FPPPRGAGDGPALVGGGAPLTLISVGRMVAKKGYDDLIEALAALPDDLNWRLVHIGGGPMTAEIKADAAARGIAERIEWRGKRDQTEVIQALRDADLFVLPSKIASDGDRDGLPNVLMEAASQKLPLLSTAVSAIPEFIEDGVHGRLAPPGNPGALTLALVELIGDAALRKRFAEAAYVRLSTEFGMDRGIDMLEERLRAVLGV
ncbi:MAG: glycosyltransferase family 4 protein, partial [Pseudomonadota bacterium]